MIPSATIAKIACLGLSPTQADAVAAMLTEVELATENKSDAAIEARRANDRDRKRRQRPAKSREVTGQDGTGGTEKQSETPEKTDIPSRVRVLYAEEVDIIERKQEDIIVAKIETPAVRKPRGDDRLLAILGTSLSPDVALGVLEHRRKLRKPLTALAAEGLAKAFADTGRPDAAARMMVERGWQGFKPEWFARDNAEQPEARAGPVLAHSSSRSPNPGKSVHAAADRLCEAAIAGELSFPPPPSVNDVLTSFRNHSREDDRRLLPQGGGGGR